MVARCGVQICIMVVYKFVVRLCSLIDVKVCPNSPFIDIPTPCPLGVGEGDGQDNRSKER